MSNGLFNLATPPAQLVLRSVVIYAGLLVLLRIFGKRQVGQFTLYDLVFILLVANALQPAMTGPDSSLGGGLLIMGTLVLLNFGLGQLDARFGLFRRLLTPREAIIIRNGDFDLPTLQHEGISEEDVLAAIHEHGLEDQNDVRMAWLEPDGSISVVPMEAKTFHSKRRFRYRQRR